MAFSDLRNQEVERLRELADQVGATLEYWLDPDEGQGDGVNELVDAVDALLKEIDAAPLDAEFKENG